MQFAILNQFPNLKHGITNRESEAWQVYDVGADQVHGVRYAWVDGPRIQPVPRTDALLTDTPNVRLRVGTSDCAPIIIYDPSTHRGGVVHAGMRGTSQEILLQVLQEFNPAAVYVAIGPAVGPECYDGIDIQQENLLQCLSAGVPWNQIEVMRLCTQCHPEIFFSYRMGDRTNFGTYLQLL